MTHSIQQIVVPENIPKGAQFIANLSYAAQPIFSMPLRFEVLGFKKAPSVGTLLFSPQSGATLAKVLKLGFQASNDSDTHARHVMRLEAIQDIPAGVHMLLSKRTGPALGWITLSDSCAREEKEDISGPMIPELLKKTFSFSHCQGYLLPDNPQQLSALLMDLTVTQGYDIVVTTGGTGLSPRDTTPEAVLRLIERRLSGFEQAMTLASLEETPRAMIARVVAGSIGSSLVLCLPGSDKAVRATLTAALPALEHALAKLQGDIRAC